MSGNVTNPDLGTGLERERRNHVANVRRSGVFIKLSRPNFDKESLEDMIKQMKDRGVEDWRWMDKNDMFQQLYDTGLLSDVKLEVEAKSFYVHKLILSMSSSVFKSWFTNLDVNSDAALKIRDLDSNDFAAVLRFIYTGEFEAESMSNVMQVAKIARRFEVEDLIESCLEYIENFLTIQNLCKVYEFSITENYHKLRTIAKNTFLCKASIVFELSEFHDCKLELVLDIVKDIASEIDVKTLFDGLLLWSIKRLEISNEASSIRKVFFPFLPQLRFLDMTADEFTACVTKKGVLFDQEIATISSYLAGPGGRSRLDPLPMWTRPKLAGVTDSEMITSPTVGLDFFEAPEKIYHSLNLPFASVSKKQADLTKTCVNLFCRFRVLKEDIWVNGVAAKAKKRLDSHVDVDRAKIWFNNENPIVQGKLFMARIQVKDDMMNFLFPNPVPLNRGEECTIQVVLYSFVKSKYNYEEGQYQEKSVVTSSLPVLMVRCLSPRLESYGLISTVFYTIKAK